MQITAITPQKKAKNRFNIFLDGKFAFALDTDNLLKFGLHVHKSLTQDEVNRLIKEDEFAKAYNKTLNYLSYRPRSKKEITDYLHKQEIGEMTQLQIVEKLEKLKLIHDEEFARWFVEQRQAFRPKGRKLLELELRRKGIAPDLAKSSSEAVKGDETGQAIKLIDKKLPQWRHLPLIKRQQRIQGYLGRRGYPWEVIKGVLERLKADKGLIDEAA